MRTHTHNCKSDLRKRITWSAQSSRKEHSTKNIFKTETKENNMNYIIIFIFEQPRESEIILYSQRNKSKQIKTPSASLENKRG
jgi:hypothetical protein